MTKDTSWIDIISKSINDIKAKTNTVFRQHFNPLNKLDINYVLTGYNWIDGLTSKDAIVTLSKSSHHLIIIPKITINKYIFDPLFKNYSDGYGFRIKFQNYEHRNKSIRIKYREESGSLIATLCPGLKKDGNKIDLLKLPNEYWEKIEILSDDPLSEFLKIVIDRVKKLSDGKGIRVLDLIE